MDIVAVLRRLVDPCDAVVVVSAVIAAVVVGVAVVQIVSVVAVVVVVVQCSPLLLGPARPLLHQVFDPLLS